MTDDPGYSVHPDILRGEETAALLAVLDRVGGRSRAGVRHLMSQGLVAAFARDPRLQALAECALGKVAVPYRATLFDKSPASNWLVGWHQDTALPLRSRHDAPGWGPWSVKGGIVYAHAPSFALETLVALRVHVDDSTESNGPLRVLPGTHRLGVLTDGQIADLAQSIEPHACTVDRGGVVALRPLLVHASSKASTDAPRRVLHIEYAPALFLDGGIQIAVA